MVDATKGRVTLSSEGDDGKVQTADFCSGRFKVTQQGDGLTELTLQGPLCKASRSTAGPLAQPAAKRKKRRRVTGELWGDGEGDRTRGQYGTATVQGTRWLTEDRLRRHELQSREGHREGTRSGQEERT